jgi:hypothetical protein
MPHTVHVICDTTEFDERVTVPDDALVRDLLIKAGLTDTMALLNYAPLYYRETQPVAASILLPVTRIPNGETLFVHERE